LNCKRGRTETAGFPILEEMTNHFKRGAGKGERRNWSKITEKVSVLQVHFHKHNAVGEKGKGGGEKGKGTPIIWKKSGKREGESKLGKFIIFDLKLEDQFLGEKEKKEKRKDAPK